MRTKLFAGVAFAALFTPAAAFAQSTGSIEFENDEIIVQGVRQDGVGGVVLPDTPRSRVAIQNEVMMHQRAGQTVNDVINLVPGVSFQNNDPWGSSGGTFTIHGFDSSRISQTVDGIPLNDTGNYAIYTNQQQDMETLEQVSVNVGSTDIDSPTASATGGTVNIRTRVPSDDFSIMTSVSYGDVVARNSGTRPYMRGFAMIDTGDITGNGLKAWFSASYLHYDNPFNNYGENDKQQYNGRIYQELGSNGDFISVAGHYNENRNTFFGSVPLRTDTAGGRVVGPNSSNRFPIDNEERFYDINYPCTVSLTGTVNSCGTEFDRRYNPSNTGNIRGSSRFTLADGLILTVDPSFQYVKANGGGVSDLREGLSGGQSGYIGGGYYYGGDYNGDGDTSDRFKVLSPSQTQTRRYIVISSLAYDLNPQNRIRLSYTFDRGWHRQTGELGVLQLNGEPVDVFPVNDPILAANGDIIEKRNRRSFATLHQISGEYRGRFFDDALTVNLGLRVPFHERDLKQYCFTTSAGGYLDCIAGSSTDIANYASAHPGYAPPQSRTYNYSAVLPSIGLVYNFTPEISGYFNFSEGLQVPGTDPLYNSLYYPDGTAGVRPDPERTFSYEGGLRYNSGAVTAQFGGWYTLFKDRLASAYDPDLDQSIYRNLGTVEKWGVDVSVSVEPVEDLLLYVWGSYLHSRIQDDLVAGTCTTSNVSSGYYGCSVPGDDYYYATAGNRESGAPDWMLGARAQYTIGGLTLGAQVKYTGERYVNDENMPVYSGSTMVYGATTPAYTLVDLDIRYSLSEIGMDNSYLQFNISNLFDELYAGGFGGSAYRYYIPNVQIGAPRAASVTLVMGF